MDLSIASRDQVLNKLNSDDATGAIRLARELLLDDPDNSDVLGLLGNALKAAGDFAGGADALRRALSLPATASIRLRNTANLAALLIASAQTSEAVELLDTAWEWVADAELRANERRCVALIGEIMTHLELRSALLALHLPIVEKSDHDWPILRQALLALSALDRADEALKLAAAYDLAHPDETECEAVLAYLYHRVGRNEDAEAGRTQYLSSAPPYISPAQTEQMFTIGVINPTPPYEDLIKSVSYRHFKTNFPHQLERKLGNRYRFASILKGSGPAALDELRNHYPKLVINNIAVAESLLSGDNLDEVEQLARSIGAPVINPAGHISLCTRQMNFERFSKLPQVVTPLLKRITLDLSRLDALQAMIERSFAYPLIVRTTGDNDGKGMVRVDSGSALRQTLLNLRRQQIYVIQYLSTMHYGKYYRKIRAAFVEGVPTVMRADYDHNWIVLGRLYAGRREFYQEHPDLLADANDIVTRPLERLGAPALAALEAIGRSMPLDIFGLDFDVDDHGAIVFFEANASMNLFGRALPEFPFPPAADVTLMERMEAFFQRKAYGTDAAAGPVSVH
jgi:tetratricopeptide (TPR) repeat protein